LLITTQWKYAEAARLISEHAFEENGPDMILEFGPLLLTKDPPSP
jgi:hypothetical protein